MTTFGSPLLSFALCTCASNECVLLANGDTLSNWQHQGPGHRALFYHEIIKLVEDQLQLIHHDESLLDLLVRRTRHCKSCSRTPTHSS